MTYPFHSPTGSSAQAPQASSPWRGAATDVAPDGSSRRPGHHLLTALAVAGITPWVAIAAVCVVRILTGQP